MSEISQFIFNLGSKALKNLNVIPFLKQVLEALLQGSIINILWIDIKHSNRIT